MEAEEARVGLTGGCQCGAIRFRLDATPVGASLCHCRMCQKAGGAPFMAFAPLSITDFVVTRGQIATFASSDIAERGFCSACGTPLTYRGVTSRRISVTVCSLDEPDAVAPEFQLGAESQVHWLADALAAPNTRTDEWLARKKIAAVDNRQHPDREI
jgi:hypothetical protein